MHSKDFQTSVGFDNGAGVAMAVRYLANPSIVHPKLILVFTIGEEGRMMKGARHFNLPLPADFMINFDAEEEDEAYYAAQGYETGRITSFLKSQRLGKSRVFKIKISGFRGGHSGVWAHEKRKNAILAITKLIRETFFDAGLRDLQDETIALEILGGDEISSNVPNSVQLRFATTRGAQLDAQLQKATRVLRERMEIWGEPNGVVSLEEEEEVRSARGIPVPELLEVVRNLENFESWNQNILVPGRDYSHDVATSSHLGYLSLRMGETMGKLDMVAFIRSFSTLERTTSYETAMRLLQRTLSDVQISDHLFADHWDSDVSTNRMVGVYREIHPGATICKAPGILESAFFAARDPQLEILSIGPQIIDPHTNRERIVISSWERTILRADKMLIRLGSLSSRRVSAGGGGCGPQVTGGGGSSDDDTLPAN